ncbi:MAG TPA: nicotinate-nucleotide adenylyltransferase [Pyrinomonadaceae bacterium]|nr:nicotinate-nucleotide adenylyltransferase [Pyrinomonadaceae bacterium]
MKTANTATEREPNSGTTPGLEGKCRRIAYYGGSFDPLHSGHLAIGNALVPQFELDAFVFIPAFHAPHKSDRKPTSGIHRYAMLAIATNADEKLSVSPMELEMPERPFTVETLERLNKLFPDTDIFFVMGADSWQDICTWRDWETVLTMANHIVITRPGFPVGFDHVTEAIRERIVDLRGSGETVSRQGPGRLNIYISDAVDLDMSASVIRKKIRENVAGWRDDVPVEVAKYIEKYELYK